MGPESIGKPDEVEIQRLVVESLAEGIIVTDAQARILACNASATRILGLSRDELLGLKTIDPAWKTIRPDGSPFPAEEYPASLVLHDGVPRNGVVMGVYKPSGELSWISINARPLLRGVEGEPAGAPVGAAISFADVTELRRTMESLRESEERHRSLIAALAEGIVVVSRDQQITSCNEAAARIFGVDAASVLGPLSALRYQAVQEDGTPFPLAEGPVSRAFSTGRPSTGVVMGIDLEGRERRWLQLNAQPLGKSPDDGLPTSVIISFTDMSEHLAAEAERRRLETQLLESQKLEAIGTLAGGIAHDFNNVLFAIQGNTEMARMELAEDHPAQASLSEALRACARAKALVQRILAFSRRQETPRRPMAIGGIVTETARLMRSALPQGVTIASEIADGLPLIVADEVEVQQIVLNLCANAGHAMKDVGGEIALRVDSVELDASGAREHGLGMGPHLRLAVSDRGQGIDPAILPRIFDPFFTTKPVGEGTGLGLAVVRQIVDSIHGAVAVRSKPGEGATFEILLPASPEAGVEEVERPRKASGQRVLFVDDEPALVRLAARLLSAVGFRVTAVGSASAALEALRASSGAYDVVLSDITMPQVNGLELAAAIQAQWPQLAIILTTGNDSPVDADAARRLGVREIIRKPWGARELLDALFRHVELPEDSSPRVGP